MGVGPMFQKPTWQSTKVDSTKGFGLGDFQVKQNSNGYNVCFT